MSEPRLMFLNMPVRDPKATMAFFTKLGFGFNKQFTDDNAASMIISEHGYAMFLKNDFFKTFTSKTICDTNTQVESACALTASSRAEVDRLMEIAIAAGAKEPRPATDHGYMYQRRFEDLDGHNWSFFWMDPAKLQPT